MKDKMKTRKDIKEEYKQIKFQMGVFQIRNISNNKIYIDNSIDILSTWNRHKFELKLGNHKNQELQNDWNEKGEDNFVFEILMELKLDDKKEVNYAKELKLLQHNQIGYIDTLSNLLNLKFIDLSGNQIDDISPLFSLSKLEFVNLTGNTVSKDQLKKLEMNGCIVCNSAS